MCFTATPRLLTLLLKIFKELIEKKIEMVDNLIEIEAAVQLLNEGQAKDENENPIDQNYKKLNTDITVLDKGKLLLNILSHVLAR